MTRPQETLFGFTPLYFFSMATAMLRRINQRGDSIALLHARGQGFDQSYRVQRVPSWINFYFAQAPQTALKLPFRVEGFGIPTEFLIDPKGALVSQSGSGFGLFTLFKDSIPSTVGTLEGPTMDPNQFFMGTRATPDAVMSLLRKSMKDAVVQNRIRDDPLSMQLMNSDNIINGQYQGDVPDVLNNLGKVAPFMDDSHMQSAIDMAVGSSSDLQMNKDQYYQRVISHHLNSMLDADARNPTVQAARAAGRMVGSAMHLPSGPLMPFLRGRAPLTADEIERESAALPILRFNNQNKPSFIREIHDNSRSRFAGELTAAQAQGLF